VRVNIYAEEMTEKLEIISKEIDGNKFTGLRFYLELPATVNGKNYQGPFIHRPGDDDSSAVTFWGKRDLRKILNVALRELDKHYGSPKPYWVETVENLQRENTRLKQAMKDAVEDFTELNLATPAICGHGEPEPKCKACLLRTKSFSMIQKHKDLLEGI